MRGAGRAAAPSRGRRQPRPLSPERYAVPRPTDDDTPDAPRLRPGRLAAGRSHLQAAPARSPRPRRAPCRGARALGGGDLERPVGDGHAGARSGRLVSVRAPPADRSGAGRGPRHRLSRTPAARPRSAAARPRRAGAGGDRHRRPLALRDARRVRAGRQGSGRLRQRGRPDRATRRAGGAGSGDRVSACRVPRPRPAVARHAELLRLALHGLLRHRSRGRHHPRPVPALPPGLDRHRLRPRRAHRRPPRHHLLDAARPGQRLRARRAPVRPDGRRGRHAAPRHQRHRGVVQRLPERRGRRPDAALRGDAGVVAGPGRQPAVLRRRRRLAARHAAVPAGRHGDRDRRLRRRGGARPDGRPAGRGRLLPHAGRLAGGGRALSPRPDEAVHGGPAGLARRPAGLADGGGAAVRGGGPGDRLRRRAAAGAAAAAAMGLARDWPSSRWR